MYRAAAERLRAWNVAGALREWDSKTAKEVRIRQGFITAKSAQHQVSPGEAYIALIEGKNINLHDSATGESRNPWRVIVGTMSRTSAAPFRCSTRN